MTETTDIIAMGRELREAKRAAKEANKEAKRLDAERKALEARFRDALESSELDHLPIDGRKLVPASTRYGQVQDRAVFVEWALENDPALVSYREEGERINDLVRERLDNGEPLPPGLGFRVQEYISDRA